MESNLAARVEKLNSKEWRVRKKGKHCPKMAVNQQEMPLASEQRPITRPMDPTQKKWKAWAILRHGDFITSNDYLLF